MSVQECGTNHAIAYHFSIETRKLDFYVKSHNFKFILKFAKALCQLKTKGIYRQQWAYKHQCVASAPWYPRVPSGHGMGLIYLCIHRAQDSGWPTTPSYELFITFS